MFAPSPVLRLTIVCLLASLCVLSGSAEPRTPQFLAQPTVLLNPNPAAPLAAILDFATDRPVLVELYLYDGRAARLLTTTKSPANQFILPVLGLRPDTNHAVTVSITDDAGRKATWPQPIVFRTDPLPGDFPAIQVTARDSVAMEPGVTLFDLNRGNQGQMVAVNEYGEVIWYYRQSVSGIGDIRPIQNGHLLFADTQGATEIDMLGNIYQRWHPVNLDRTATTGAVPLRMDLLHHEVFETQSGSFLTLDTEVRPFASYPTSETNPNATPAAANVVGDAVLEFDRNGQFLQRWSLLDILDPFRIVFDPLGTMWNATYSTLSRGTRDWSHANAIIEDPHDRSVIVSVRHQDALVKLERNTGRLIWILGTPDGWNPPWTRYLLTPKGDVQWQYHQHAPMISPKGTILLFDNGNNRRRPTEPLPTSNYSRVVEFAIDEERMTVSQVWSYGPENESFFSSALGDVDWLPLTQNLLIADGFRVTDGNPNDRWARVFEITHTTPTRKVFEVVVRDVPGTTPVGWRIYRAERMPSLYP